MIIQFPKSSDQFVESEWCCENWGYDDHPEDGDDPMSIVYAPHKWYRKVDDDRPRREEEETEEEEEEEEEEDETEEEEDEEGEEEEDETEETEEGEGEEEEEDETEEEEEEGVTSDTDTDVEVIKKCFIFSPPRHCRSSALQFVINGSRLALDQYNNNQGTKYYFFCLEEVLSHSVPLDKDWNLHFIEFKASSKLVPTNDNDIVIFRSKILFGSRWEQLYYYTLVLDVQKPVGDIKLKFENNILRNVPTEKAMPRIIISSILAVDDFNKNKNSKYSFVSLVKASAYLVCDTDWYVYNILFNAHLPDEAAPDEIFRAKVFDRRGVASVVMVVKSVQQPITRMLPTA